MFSLQLANGKEEKEDIEALVLVRRILLLLGIAYIPPARFLL